MKESRTNGRQATSRTFQPALDGRLEDRVLLTRTDQADRRRPRLAQAHQAPRRLQCQSAAVPGPRCPRSSIGTPDSRSTSPIGIQTARGGQNVEVTALDGSHYMVTLSYTSNTLATNIAEGANGQGGASSAQSTAEQVAQQNARYPQPIGTVRAYPMPGGRVGIIVDGSTQNTELAINPLGHPAEEGLRSQLRLRRGEPRPRLEHRPDHDQQRLDRRHPGLPEPPSFPARWSQMAPARSIESPSPSSYPARRSRPAAT